MARLGLEPFCSVASAPRVGLLQACCVYLFSFFSFTGPCAQALSSRLALPRTCLLFALCPGCACLTRARASRCRVPPCGSHALLSLAGVGGRAGCGGVPPRWWWRWVRAGGGIGVASRARSLARRPQRPPDLRPPPRGPRCASGARGVLRGKPAAGRLDATQTWSGRGCLCLPGPLRPPPPPPPTSPTAPPAPRRPPLLAGGGARRFGRLTLYCTYCSTPSKTAPRVVQCTHWYVQ